VDGRAELSKRRWVAVVIVLTACLALPALAHDRDEEFDGDDGSLRHMQHMQHHRQRQQAIVPNTPSGATQPYWGTTQPYWGTTQPYWGPSGAPAQQLPGRTPLNRRPR
jgi:hypothetical protein